jgi:hypothetical protein
MNFPGKSIAASAMDPSIVEATVLSLLEKRGTCALTLSDDVLRRIQTIRGFCKGAESIDGNGQIGWRRGNQNKDSSQSGSRTTGGNGGGHGTHGNTQNRWRSSTTVFPIKSGHSSNEKSGPGSGSSRYVSKFKNTELAVEDKILNQVILNKLNKFGEQNYDSVKQFLKQILDSDETDFLHSFMLLVFKKAAVEPTFCPLYARLVSELSDDYPSFKKELHELYVKYLDIFEEISEEHATSYEQYVQRNREKIHRLGYSQFLGELTSYGILELEQLKILYIKILDELKKHSIEGEAKQQLVEEYVDCLVKMTKAFQKKESSATLCTLCKQLGGACEPILEDILSNRTKAYPGLSKKGAFGIMDCLDIFRAVPK